MGEIRHRNDTRAKQAKKQRKNKQVNKVILDAETSDEFSLSLDSEAENVIEIRRRKDTRAKQAGKQSKKKQVTKDTVCPQCHKALRLEKEEEKKARREQREARKEEKKSRK